VRSDRLLATLLLLQTHGRLSAPEIARRLEVSTRTVTRDVEALSAAGVPVYSERGRRGGVVLLPGFRTDLTGLTDVEMRALFVHGGVGSGERGLAPALASAVRKLMAAVPPERRPGVDAARRRVLVEPLGWRRAADEVPALPALEAAVLADERIRIRYRPAGDGRGEGVRTVDPYGLVSKGGTWYLVAAHRGALRLYRVGRVLEVTATGVPARRPDDRGLDEVWAGLRDGVERAPDPMVVRLRVDPAWRDAVLRVVAPQLVGPPVRSGTGHPDEVELTFRAAGAARGALLGFGAVLEVLSPPGVRADLAATAAGVVDLYAAGLPGSAPNIVPPGGARRYGRAP